MVVVLGVTGAGKSTICNSMAGHQPDGDFFPSSASPSVCTYKTVGKPANWLGDHGKPFTLCDTPGLGDPAGKDSENILNMVETLKEVKYVNAFIIVFNGQNPRFDKDLKDMLLLFQNIFGKGFLKNAIIEFSRWGFDKRSVKMRTRNNISEQEQAQLWNQKFHQEIGTTESMPVVFVDALYDQEDDQEVTVFKNQTDFLWKTINKMKPYECKDFQAILTENDQLKKDIAEAKEIQRQAGLFILNVNFELSKVIFFNLRWIILSRLE